MFHCKKLLRAIILSSFMLLPNTTHTIDKSAVIAAGALVGVVSGTLLNYYLNDKKTEPKPSKPGIVGKIKKYLNEHPTIRNVVLITAGACTGAITTYCVLNFYNMLQKKNKQKEDTGNTVPKPRDEDPVEHTWWQDLTKQNEFKDSAELLQKKHEWTTAIETHFAGRPDKITLYKGLLNQLTATLKHYINSKMKDVTK